MNKLTHKDLYETIKDLKTRLWYAAHVSKIYIPTEANFKVVKKGFLFKWFTEEEGFTTFFERVVETESERKFVLFPEEVLNLTEEELIEYLKTNTNKLTIDN